MATLTITAVDTATNIFTTSAAHGLTSGNDVRLSAESAPGGLVNNTTYHARVIDSTSFAVHTAVPTRLALTVANCVANVAVASFATQSVVPFAVGSTIRVRNVTAPTSYNGSFVVTDCTVSNVRYSLPTAAAGTTLGATVEADTRAMAKTGYNTIDITTAGTSVTFLTTDVLQISSHSSHSNSFGTGAAPAVISMPFSDYAVEPRYIAHSSVSSTARINSDQQALQSAYETALAVIATPFGDYNFESRYVATNSLLGLAQIEDDYQTLQVSAVGLVTSPTYVYTDGAPKAAPGPAIISEVWYLS